MGTIFEENKMKLQKPVRKKLMQSKVRYKRVTAAHQKHTNETFGTHTLRE